MATQFVAERSFEGGFTAFGYGFTKEEAINDSKIKLSFIQDLGPSSVTVISQEGELNKHGIFWPYKDPSITLVDKFIDPS